MPLTWLSYAFDFAAFGDWFGGFHIHSILLHAINTVLVWRLLLLLCDSDGKDARWLCLLGAVLWAIHPLRCESVAALSSRKDVLSLFWELLAFHCWVGGSKTKGRRAVVFTGLSMFFFAIGAMCKPSVMTFPLLCLVVDVFIVRQVKVLRYIAPMLLMIFLAVFAAWQQKANGMVVDIYNEPFWWRILNAFASFGVYVRNTIWPVSLAPQCVKMWPRLPQFLLPGIILTNLCGWYLYRSLRGYWIGRKSWFVYDTVKGVPTVLRFEFQPNAVLAGVIWFIVAIGPMMGVASFGFHAFADRFTYIPSIGLSISLIGLFLLIPHQVHLRRVAVAASVCVVLSLAALTWRQTGFWKDDGVLFTHTLEVDGDQNGFAHGVVANWCFEFPHDLERCVDEFKRATETDIRHILSSYEIYIFALCELGRNDDILPAIRKYESAMDMTFGPERATQIRQGGLCLAGDEAMAQTVYLSSRIAWWLTDEKSLASAERLLNRFKGPALEKDQVWQYVQWRFHLAKGNLDEAKRFHAMLVDSAGKTGYTQFRYLYDTKDKEK